MSTTPKSTEDDDRILSLDVIRGVAVLGIFIMNGIIMGLSYPASVNPSLFSETGTANMLAWYVPALLFEGTFRTMFGMLFGAGVFIFMARAEAKTDPPSARRLHIRRTLWLMAFGLVDMALFLWYGDVLFLYGVMGLLLWTLRRLNVLHLGLLVVLFTGISAFLSQGMAESTRENQIILAGFDSRTAQGESLSPEELATYESLKAQESFTNPSAANLKQQAETIRFSYAGAATAYWPIALVLNTVLFAFFSFWDSALTMTLGMLLFKTGFLGGALSFRTYGLVALCGYGLAIPLRVIHLGALSASGFDPLVQADNQIFYDIERVGMAFGHLGLILAALKAGLMPLEKSLAATGRMALSNYLLQSLIGLLLFVGFGLYMELSRAALMGVIIAVWGLQLTLSPWWLARFRFGPAEWLWRTLTYGTRQALRR